MKEGRRRGRREGDEETDEEGLVSDATQFRVTQSCTGTQTSSLTNRMNLDKLPSP